MRLNLGSGNYPLAGWTNVDAYVRAGPEFDYRELDFREVTFVDVEEVNMSHVLEHIGWRETSAVLARIRTWMRGGGTISIEVPDMEEILKLGTVHPLWFKYVYGDQSTPGETHLAGFTGWMLWRSLVESGWIPDSIVTFLSTHPGRESMPCLLAKAHV